MITGKKLFDRYSTGRVYTNGAAIDYFDSKIRTRYQCEAEFGELLRDYIEHLLFPPSDLCFDFPRSTDSVIRDGGMSMDDEEKEWLMIEYKLRNALNGCTGAKVKFVVVTGGG